MIDKIAEEKLLEMQRIKAKSKKEFKYCNAGGL